MHPTVATTLILAPLIGWRVYMRFRRMVGRQKLSRYRPWVHLVIFPAIIALLTYASRHHVERLGWLAGALVLGGLLSIWGLRQTKYEVTPGRLYYTPHSGLGITLSLLFVARIVWRVIEVFYLEPDAPHGLEDFGHNPVTLAVFGLLAGYYVGYAVGLMRWRFGVLRAKRERKAAQQS